MANLTFFNKLNIHDVKKSHSLKQKLIVFLKYLGLLYLFIIITSIIVHLFDNYIFNKYGTSIQEVILKQQSKNHSNLSLYCNLLQVCLFSPIIEEIIYRLPLDLKKWNIAISLSLCCLFFIQGIYIYDFQSFYTIGKIVLAVLVLVCFYFVKKNVFTLNNRSYFIYFYSLASIFALIHILNFYSALPNNLLIFSVLYVFPQFYLAVFSGYLRLKNGLFWSILLHCTYNITSLLLLLINK